MLGDVNHPEIKANEEACMAVIKGEERLTSIVSSILHHFW